MDVEFLLWLDVTLLKNVATGSLESVEYKIILCHFCKLVFSYLENKISKNLKSDHYDITSNQP